MKLSLKAKIGLIILVFNLILIGILTYSINQNVSETVARDLSKRLEHIAGTASTGLSKKNFKGLYKKFRKEGGEAVNSKEFTRVANYLKRIKKVNELSSDVYTAFIPSWAPDKMIFLAMSSEEPYLGNAIEVTDIVKKVYKTKKTQYSDIYTTDRGEWISGVSPIISKDKVIGILQVDYSTSGQLAMALDMAFDNLIVPIIIVLVVVSVLLIFAINTVMKSLTLNIQKNINSLSHSSNQLNDSSEKASEFSLNINEMNSKHLISLESASSSLEEINAMSKKASENTDHAVKIANGAVDRANRGKETIQDMLESISTVSETNKKVTTRMSRIRQEISEITKVISSISEKTSIINDIVFQTKLLSFNASVEAARAGEHGKGFSVLAQEIGNLASLSGKSSEEISEILISGTETVEEIIATTEKDMKALVGEANLNIDKAVEVGRICEESMSEIFENINTVIKMMNEIHHATKEQAEGISLANESVHVLSSQSSEYKRVSQKSKEIAEQLTNQIDNLKNVVKFLESTAKGNEKVS